MRIEAITDMEGLRIPDSQPFADQEIIGPQELAMMHTAVAALPERCMSQKEVAVQMRWRCHRAWEGQVERMTCLESDGSGYPQTLGKDL